jgi:hypothetical protein
MATSPPGELDSAGLPAWSFRLCELSPRATWHKVGEGSFGHVYRADLLGTPVAVKEASNAKESRLDGIRRDILYLRRAAPPCCAPHTTRQRRAHRAPRRGGGAATRAARAICGGGGVSVGFLEIRFASGR